MTRLTDITGQRMVQAFTQTGAGTVVATGLGTGLTHDGIVVKHGVQKAGGAVMTDVALGGGGHMRPVFAQSNHAVMAAAAHIGGLIMGKGYDHRLPRARVVAAFTAIGAQWMGRGFVRAAMTTLGGTADDDGLVMRKRQ